MELVVEKYKKTEVGLIPSDWEMKFLGELGENIIGLTYSPSNVKDYGHLVLRSSNIQKNKLAFENNVFVEMELPQRVIVKENDILICVRNGSKNLIGKCALIDKQTEGSAFGAFMSVYRTEYSNFIFHQFQSNIIQKQIDEVMGATINQLTNKDLSTFQIPLPPTKAEQTAIATALSDADALISGLEKLIAKKRNIKQGAMQKLLQPKEGWEVKKLGEVGEVRMCKRIFSNQTKERGDIPFFKIGTFGSEPDAYISNELYVEFKQKFSFPKKGDILISAAGTIGRTVVYNGEPSYFQDSNIVWIDNTESLISNQFLFYILQIVEFNTEGGTIQRLYNSIIRNTEFHCPTKEEQTRIATVLSDMDAEITALETKLEKYRKVKLGMMQNLLTGKIRLV